MKRYKKLTTTIPIWPGGEIKSESEMVEDPQGEWVKREDVMNLQSQAYETGYYAGENAEKITGHIQAIDNLKGCLGAKGLKCNCDEMFINHACNWICPAHGYKKR